MICPCSIFLGYFVSVIIGTFVIWLVINEWLWRLIEEDLEDGKIESGSVCPPTPRGNIIKATMGVLEQILYTTVILVKVPEWIVFWITIKVAVTWKSSLAKKYTASHNVFLAGNALSVLFGLLGAWIALGCPNIFFIAEYLGHSVGQ